MNRLMTMCFLVALALPAAAVEDGEVKYAGGTAATLHAGVIGRLDTASATTLTFEYSGTKLLIPYADIQSFHYSTEVTHHLGVLPGIAVALLKKRERRHFFRISYRDVDHADQVAVFEVSKRMPRTLQAILEARVPHTCKAPSPGVCRN